MKLNTADFRPTFAPSKPDQANPEQSNTNQKVQQKKPAEPSSKLFIP